MTDKEQLDKIDRIIGLSGSDDGFDEYDFLMTYRHQFRPRLEKALRLLEMKELQDAMDSGDDGQTVVR